MKGLASGDLDVVTDSVVKLDNLDFEAISSLLHKTNQKQEDFVITDNDKPIAAIISLEEYSKLFSGKVKVSAEDMGTYLDQYEKELDLML